MRNNEGGFHSKRLNLKIFNQVSSVLFDGTFRA